ncbi:MAG: gliding motility-associated C-terminal domain-containing protein [Bacteroidota bacterium]
MHKFMGRIVSIISLCCLFASGVQAQFILNGTAMAIGDSCFQLTPTEDFQAGSIWNEEKVNLNESFEVLVDIFVGCQDLEGADGIVFGLQPVSTAIGTAGESLGFGGVQPSLGVEFDTHENINLADPIFDHIAIIRDGQLNHNVPQGALAGPIQATSFTGNIEDCEYHPLRIRWDVESLTLSVYLDCELRLTYTGDIVNDIFGGDPLVFWGFTSATGGLNNIHEICFNYTTFLDQLVDQTICPGEDVPLEATGGVSYSWSPAEGLSDANIANPIASPTETTTYVVEVTDDCGFTFTDDVVITVDNDQFEATLITDPADLTEINPGGEFVLGLLINPPGSYLFGTPVDVLGSTLSEPDSTVTTADGSIAYFTVTASVTDTGTETLMAVVTSEDGCVQEATFSFEIRGGLYAIPDIFSPNGDGVNDLFGVYSAIEVSNFNMQVFNRWGSNVYETNSQAALWDGTFEADPAPSDVYLYQINFEIGELQFEEKGSVTLVR